MPVVDPSLELQKAIVAAVKADAGMTALINGRIYDAVPMAAVKPYVSFGPFDLVPDEGDCLDGAAVAIQLDGWANGPDTVEVKRLGKALAAALDESNLPLDPPQRMVGMKVEFVQYLREPDGITAHVVMTVRATCEPIEEGPVNLIPPVISGDTQVGETLICTEGTWSP